MRIDLYTDDHRPWPVRVGLALAQRYVGVDLGPPTVMSYRPALFSPELRGYILRSAHGDGGWSKGETELMSSFVSKLNSCHF